MAVVFLGVLATRDASVFGRVTGLRASALLLAAGAAYALDDPAASIVACSPTPLGVRRSLRLGLVSAAAMGVWAALLAVAGEPVVPFAGALTVEAAGMLSVALAAASVGGGAAGGPTLLVLVLGSLSVDATLPQWKTLLLLAPGDPAWATSHLRWLVLAGAGAVVIAWASRDPAPA